MKNVIFSVYDIQLAWQPNTPKLPHTIQFCLICRNGNVRFIDDIRTSYPAKDISFGTPKSLAETPFISFAGRGKSNLALNDLYFLEAIYQRQIKDKKTTLDPKLWKKRDILKELYAIHTREKILINDLEMLEQ